MEVITNFFNQIWAFIVGLFQPKTTTTLTSGKAALLEVDDSSSNKTQ